MRRRYSCHCCACLPGVAAARMRRNGERGGHPTRRVPPAWDVGGVGVLGRPRRRRRGCGGRGGASPLAPPPPRPWWVCLARAAASQCKLWVALAADRARAPGAGPGLHGMDGKDYNVQGVSVLLRLPLVASSHAPAASRVRPRCDEGGGPRSIPRTARHTGWNAPPVEPCSVWFRACPSTHPTSACMYTTWSGGVHCFCRGRRAVAFTRPPRQCRVQTVRPQR